MHTYVHTYITYIHTYLPTYIHTYIHTHICTCTYVFTHMHACNDVERQTEFIMASDRPTDGPTDRLSNHHNIKQPLRAVVSEANYICI